MTHGWIRLGVLAALLTAISCGDDGTAGGGGAGADGAILDVMTPDGAQQLCGGGCACSDGVDNDGDGQVDGFDDECTGPYDDDEGSFATGIPGDNRDPMWQDCFFDGNSGAGDDQCRYRTECLTGTLPPSHPDCLVSQACVEFCAPRTPNGCDCFGCCNVTLETGETIQVAIGGECTIEEIENETLCPRCSASDQCGNECGECELCPGREVSDLPDTCIADPDAGTPTYTCDNGEQVCDDSAPCPTDFYCQLGCCLPVPI